MFWGRDDPSSGCFKMVFCHQLAGQAQHLIGEDGLGKETDVVSGVLGLIPVGVAQDQNRQERHACVKLGYKGRTADAGEAVS